MCFFNVYIYAHPPMVYPPHVSIATKKDGQDTRELYHRPVYEFIMLAPNINAI